MAGDKARVRPLLDEAAAGFGWARTTGTRRWPRGSLHGVTQSQRKTKQRTQMRHLNAHRRLAAAPYLEVIVGYEAQVGPTGVDLTGRPRLHSEI